MKRRGIIIALAFSWLVAGAGCALFRTAGSIHTAAGSVVGVKDAGKPATLATSSTTEGLTLPAGTTVTTTKTDATPAGQDPKSGAWFAFQPAREVTSFTVPEPVRWEKAQTAVAANTGTVDTSIAAKRIDSEESRPLLYAALASVALAAFFVYLHYPTPAMISGAASGLFFLAWKVSGVPDWLWAVGAVALAAAAFLYFGHKRGESDAKAAPVVPTPPPTP